MIIYERPPPGAAFINAKSPENAFGERQQKHYLLN